MTLKAIVIDLEMVEVELLLNRVLARLRRIHIKLESSPYFIVPPCLSSSLGSPIRNTQPQIINP